MAMPVEVVEDINPEDLHSKAQVGAIEAAEEDTVLTESGAEQIKVDIQTPKMMTRTVTREQAKAGAEEVTLTRAEEEEEVIQANPLSKTNQTTSDQRLQQHLSHKMHQCLVPSKQSLAVLVKLFM